MRMKMKTKNLLVMAALAGAMTLTGCTNTDEVTTENPNFPTDGVMRFASSVESPTTRAGYGDGTNGTTNVTTKDLYLWVTPQGETAGSKYIYKGIILHHTEAGGWGSYSALGFDNIYTPTTLLWKNKTTKVDVVAGNFGGAINDRIDLPASANVSIFTSQSTAANVASSDKLYFKGTVDPSATADVTTDGTYALDASGKIRLPMRHICSKLNITLTLGNEFSMEGAAGKAATNPISGLTIGKMYNADNFNMQTGAFIGEYKDWQGNPATPTDFTPFTNTWTPAATADARAVANYECILVPQTVATGGFSVTFTIGGKVYTWTATSDITLESGKQHNLALTAGKDVVTMGSFTASAWTEGTGGSLETE